MNLTSELHLKAKYGQRRQICGLKIVQFKTYGLEFEQSDTDTQERLFDTETTKIISKMKKTLWRFHERKRIKWSQKQTFPRVFTRKMAAKTTWHRYEDTKIRNCYAMYCWQRFIVWINILFINTDTISKKSKKQKCVDWTEWPKKHLQLP